MDILSLKIGHNEVLLHLPNHQGIVVWYAIKKGGKKKKKYILQRNKKHWRESTQPSCRHMAVVFK